MTFFGLKSGQDLENRAALIVTKNSPEYAPSGGQERGVNHVIIIIA